MSELAIEVFKPLPECYIHKFNVNRSLWIVSQQKAVSLPVAWAAVVDFAAGTGVKISAEIVTAGVGDTCIEIWE